MVEGDGCHRIAAEHRKSLVGRKMQAKSPNGRFKGGASAIMKCGGVLTRIEVHGKNMFYFFGQGSKVVVVHVHFGLAGVAFKIEMVLKKFQFFFSSNLQVFSACLLQPSGLYWFWFKQSITRSERSPHVSQFSKSYFFSTS